MNKQLLPFFPSSASGAENREIIRTDAQSAEEMESIEVERATKFAAESRGEVQELIGISMTDLEKYSPWFLSLTSKGTLHQYYVDDGL